MLALSGCKSKQSGDAGDAAASSSASQEPVLNSRYASPWGELGWQERLHNTIAFTTPDESVFLRCTLYDSPTMPCTWSRADAAAPDGWNRGRAKLTVQPDGTVKGTWGNGDSDDDGGPFELKPLPRY